MNTETSYEIGALPFLNPVYDAAIAFLAAAESAFDNEANKKGFLSFQHWYVPHHLSVVATELFLKSFRVIVSHGPVTDPDGPDDLSYQHAFGGHVAQLDKLPPHISKGLKNYLPDSLYNLMISLHKDHISQGRYPYENYNGSQRFPAGNDGKNLAQEWLSLARALSNFKEDPHNS